MPSASVPPPAAKVLTADAETDPESWLKVACILVILFSVAQVLVFSFGRDQSIYGVIAEGMLEGKVPYRDLWDFKPPGIFFIYAASFALFGKTMLAPRLIEVGMLIGAVLGLRRLGGVLFDSQTSGLIAGAVYALVHAQMDFWHTGQPESFAGPLSIYALVMTTHEWPRRQEALVWTAIGVLFGAAFVLKPPFGGGAVACAYFLMARRRQDGRSWPSSLAPFLLIGVGSLAPLLGTLIWFQISGGLPALSWTLFEFAPGYTKLSWAGREASGMFFHALSLGFFGLSSLLAMGTVAALSIHPRAPREREAFLLILGVLAFQMIGITVQGKFFQYHFGASIGLIAMIAGHGYYKLFRRVAVGSLSGTLAFCAFLFVAQTMKRPVNDVPETFGQRSLIRLKYLLSAGRSLTRAEMDEEIHRVAGYDLAVVRRTAEEMERLVPPGSYSYVWGFEPALYSLSHTKPSSRYIYNVPQRATWQRERARSTLLSELRAHPPAIFITQRRDAMAFVTGNRLDSTDSLPHFPALDRYLKDHFAAAKVIDRFTIWLPRPKAQKFSP